MHWLWVHQYERGRGLIDSAWLHIVSRYEDLEFEGPFTRGGATVHIAADRPGC